MNIRDQFKHDGKTALVIGVKRGKGKAIALGLAEAGADIIGDIAPGYTEIGYAETGNTEAFRNDADCLQAILSRIPAGRWGTLMIFTALPCILPLTPPRKFTVLCSSTMADGWEDE